MSVLSFATAGLKTALLSVLTLILRFERLQPIAAAEVVEVEKRKKKKINAVLRFDGLR